MAHIKQNPVASTAKAGSSLTSYFLRGEPGKSDREVDHDYVPMNVYIDPWTMKTRFQGLLTQSS